MKETTKNSLEENSKVFTVEGFMPAERYLKEMLSHVDRNGVIEIARDEVPEIAFTTSQSVEGATLVERFELDPKKVGFDSVLSFYSRLIESMKSKSLKSELEKLDKKNKLSKRVAAFSKRVDALTKFDNPRCPDIVLHNEQCMLIDSVALYLGTER